MSEINLYNMDCMKLMKSKPKNYYDLAIVDPPYGINSEKKNSGFLKKLLVGMKANKWDRRPSKEYFKELFRVSKNQLIFGCQYFMADLPDSSQLIIWNKKTGGNYFADGEAIFCSIPGTLRIFDHQWCGAFKDSERGVKTICASQKPLALYHWLLCKYSKYEDRILDTHGGSMGSAIVCDELDLDMDLCELDEEIFSLGKNRYDIFASQLRLF